MVSYRAVFQSNSIEFDRNPNVTKASTIRAIGELFIYAGYSLTRHAEEFDLAIPESFDLIKDVDGWDIRFVLKLNTKSADEDKKE